MKVLEHRAQGHDDPTPSILHPQSNTINPPANRTAQVYNITRYLKFHPGGVDILAKVAGKDGTSLFMKYHPWVAGDALLQQCLVGWLAVDPRQALAAAEIAHMQEKRKAGAAAAVDSGKLQQGGQQQAQQPGQQQAQQPGQQPGQQQAKQGSQHLLQEQEAEAAQERDARMTLERMSVLSSTAASESDGRAMGMCLDIAE